MMTTQNYKIVVLDSSKLGTSNLVSQYVYGRNQTTYHAVSGDTYAHYELFVGGKLAQFEIHATAGSDKCPSLRKHHIEVADAFVLVYNLTCNESFNAVKKISAEDIKEVGNTDVPMIVLGNDQGNEDKERAVSKEEGDALAIDWGCIYMEVTKEILVDDQAVFNKLAKQLFKMSKKKQKREHHCSIM